jgi:hypothetical protein
MALREDKWPYEDERDASILSRPYVGGKASQRNSRGQITCSIVRLRVARRQRQEVLKNDSEKLFRKELSGGFVPAVIDHQTAVLHDLNARAGEAFGDLVVAYSRLEPDGPRPFGQ